jgi:hypothetical protein
MFPIWTTCVCVCVCVCVFSYRIPLKTGVLDYQVRILVYNFRHFMKLVEELQREKYINGNLLKCFVFRLF